MGSSSGVLHFKAQVTNHTQSAACPNSSVAVLFYGLLQKFLFCDRFLPVWWLIIAAETISLKEKPIHFEWATLRDPEHRDLVFTGISITTTRQLLCKWDDASSAWRGKLWNQSATDRNDTNCKMQGFSHRARPVNQGFLPGEPRNHLALKALFCVHWQS